MFNFDPKYRTREQFFCYTNNRLGFVTGKQKLFSNLTTLFFSAIMKIHEYQAKELMEREGIAIPPEQLCFTPDEVRAAALKLGLPVVVKAQVHAGGRGKAGGVRLAANAEDAQLAGKQILGMSIKNLVVEKVLVAKAVDIVKEFYVGLTIDRNKQQVVLMVSPEGGVEIEEVAKTKPELIYKFYIDPDIGLREFQAREAAFKLFENIDHVRKTTEILVKLYHCFIKTDASLAEINPLVLTGDNNIVVLDGKMNFDDNALFRQKEIEDLREATQNEIKEIEAKNHGLSYIRLDGNIGCMVNGAGLAMATMDLIKLYGGEPANFLDVGGSSNPQKVVAAMKLLAEDKNVKVVMINIFGGITRCDDVAMGIIESFKQIEIKLPVVVRLSGTNAHEGLEILRHTNLISVETMAEAAQKAISLIS